MVVDGLGFETWWVMAHNSDGPRRRTEVEQRGAEDVARAVDKEAASWARGTDRAVVTVDSIAEDATSVYGRVRIEAIAPDATHVRATTMVTQCFRFTVDRGPAPETQQTWRPFSAVEC